MQYQLTADCGSTTATSASATAACDAVSTNAVVFPPLADITVANTCNAALTLPTVAAVTGFNKLWTITAPGGSATTYNTDAAASAALTNTPGAWTISVAYQLAASCGSTPINASSSATACDPVSVIANINSPISITAVASCVGISQPMAGMSLDVSAYLPQYNITVTSVSGGNNGSYNVTINGVTQVFNGSTLTFGPFNHSTPLTGNVPVTVTATDLNPPNGSPVCSGSTLVNETLCAPSGVYCDCANTSPVPASSGIIIAQSTPGTYNSNGYTQFYVLVQNGAIVTTNSSGLSQI
ncbi:MAG: hypothetical protein IPL08_06055 [Saprospiraceae bacterium]|nr:hypothetical protein [Saprospiraceae bacterium]